MQTKKKKSKGILTREKPRQRKICDLTIVADHTYFQEVGGGSLDSTILQMLWHIKEANEMIQSEDFDNDGTSECIGFTVSEITIFQEAQNAVNLLTGDFAIPEVRFLTARLQSLAILKICIFVVVLLLIYTG